MMGGAGSQKEWGEGGEVREGGKEGGWVGEGCV